jgi:hypothetical protein
MLFYHYACVLHQGSMQSSYRRHACFNQKGAAFISSFFSGGAQLGLPAP